MCTSIRKAAEILLYRTHPALSLYCGLKKTASFVQVQRCFDESLNDLGELFK